MTPSIIDAIPSPWTLPLSGLAGAAHALGFEQGRVRQAVSGDTPVYWLGNSQGTPFFFEIFRSTETRMIGLWETAVSRDNVQIESGLWKWHLPVWGFCVYAVELSKPLARTGCWAQGSVPCLS